MTPQLNLQPLVERVRTDVTAKKNAVGVQSWTREALTQARIVAHCTTGPARGVCPIKAGESTTQVALFDLDSHKGETPWEEMIAVAVKLAHALFASHGLNAIPFSSSGGKGIHLYVLWDEPQDAYSVRRLLADVLASIGFKSGTKGVSKHEIEIFPKQNSVPLDGFGNQFILPLAGESVPLINWCRVAKDHPVKWDMSQPVPVLEHPEAVAPAEILIAGLEEVQAALDAIPNTGDKELDYDTWRNVIFALHQATHGSEDGLHLAHKFSAKSSKYDPAFLDERVWPYISDREAGITVRTLFAIARRHGWSTQPSDDDFEVLPDDDSTDAMSPKKPRFEFVTAEAFANGKSPSWIIKGVLPAAEVCMVYGPPGSGKTFFVLDLLGAIATGGEDGLWQGRKLKPGPCAYIAAEGAGGVRSRVRAYAESKGILLSNLPLFVLGDAPNFTDPKQVKAVIEAALTIGPYGTLRVIAVDTYASVMPGGNENSSEDAGAVIRACKDLHKATGALILLIHHSGKDASKGARGWSGMLGAVDAELEVVRGEEGTRQARITKLKDGTDEEVAFGFRLNQHPAGRDEDGEPINSCVVHYTEFVETVPTKKVATTSKQPSISSQELLDGMLQESGQVLTTNLLTVLQRDLGLRNLDDADKEITKLVKAGLITREGGYCVRPPAPDDLI